MRGLAFRFNLFHVQLICFFFICCAFPARGGDQVHSNLFHYKTMCGTETKSEYCDDLEVYDDDTNSTDLCNEESFCIQYHELARTLDQTGECYTNAGRNETNFLGFDVTYVTGTNVTNATTGEVIYDPTPTYRDGNKCRDEAFLENLRNSASANETGFSPWRYVINRDINRCPMDILETRCICTSCLEPSRRRDSREVASYPFMITRYFRLHGYGNKTFHSQFSYGCFCELRNIFDGNSDTSVYIDQRFDSLTEN